VRLTLLKVPYHLGRAGAGMALGPGRYLDGGLPARLQARGHDVAVVEVARPGPFEDELGAIVAINDALAVEVKGARAAGRLPLVAGGNCNVALGMTAGLGPATTGIVWFDAHGDFNTPQTTPSGFLDGMPLAIACGVAHAGVWADRHGRVDARRCIHAGGRDLDPGEVEGFARAGVAVLTVDDVRGEGGALTRALAALADPRVVYLHVDIDVLDPATAPGVDFPSPGGLSLGELIAAVTLVAAGTTLRGLSVTAYDPERDDAESTTLALGIDLVCRLVETIAGAQR
jgi:arginase